MAAPSTFPPRYVIGMAPILPGGDQKYLQAELEKLRDSLNASINLLPQAATAAPKALVDGMIRLARSPWRPIGGTVDAWVYYDTPSTSWKAL